MHSHKRLFLLLRTEIFTRYLWKLWLWFNTSIFRSIIPINRSINQSVLSKSKSFTANTGTKAAVLPKVSTSTANSGSKVADLLGMNRSDSFPFLSAPHSLFSTYTDLKRSQAIVDVRRVYLANWALRTSPKITTGLKYQFHQRFDQIRDQEIPITLRSPIHNRGLKFLQVIYERFAWDLT